VIAPFLEYVHATLTTLQGSAPLSFVLAAAAGLLLAFSPAMLALASVSATLVAADPSATIGQVLRRSAALALGTATTFGAYGLVFGVAGAAVAPAFGTVGFGIAGAVVVALGLAMLGVLRVPSPGMAPPLRPPRSSLGAYALGLPFGLAGSTCPCAIPVVLSLLLYAGSLGSPWLGAALLFVFAFARGAGGVLVVLGAGLIATWAYS